jgi:hypothetical protein
VANCSLSLSLSFGFGFPVHDVTQTLGVGRVSD